MITKPWVIYVLSEPGAADPLAPDAVRYVGFTTTPAVHRAKRHCLESTREKHQGYNTHKSRWLRKLIGLGLSPCCTVLHEAAWVGTDLDEFKVVWGAAETKWIAHYRAAGARLTNATDGGDGGLGWVPSPEVRAKMSAVQRGRKHSPETRKKIATGNRGKRHGYRKKSLEHRAKLVANLKASVEARRGVPLSPATRAKLSSAGRGKKRSPDAIAKSANGLRGQKRTLATRAKISAAKRGRPNLRARGRHLSPETRAKISAAAREQAHPVGQGHADVLQALAHGPLRVCEVMRALGKSRGTIEHLCSRMVANGTLRRISRGVYGCSSVQDCENEQEATKCGT